MAFKHGANARVYVNGYDLSAYLRQIGVTGKADAADVTTFGAAAKSYLAGLRDATLTAEGVFDGAVGAVDAVLEAALGANRSLWSIWPQGEAAVGDIGYGLDAIATSYEVSSPAVDVTSIAAEAQSKVGPERLLSLHPMAARTASADGTSLDHGAATTNGGVGYLQVTAASGTTPTLAVKIQHSPDAVTWTDLITFTQVTAANQSERKTVTGTINRYLRASWTIGGTSPSFTFSVAFGRR